MKIYTRKGDDGTTGLLYGGRVAKDSAAIEANGAVDEAQAALGVARAEVERGSELDELLVGLERDLYVLMAELATAARQPGQAGRRASPWSPPRWSRRLEQQIDELTGRFPPVTEFVIPGHDRVAAAPRRGPHRGPAGRAAGPAPPPADGSLVVAYLNRLSDLLWTMARWQEQGESLPQPPGRPGRRPAGSPSERQLSP